MKRPRHTRRRKAAARSASSSSVSEAVWADSVGAKKMRATARAMGSYTARLRPYFDKLLAYVDKLRPYLDKLLAYVDKLRPYANGLRRHAVEAWTSARILVALGENDPGYAGRIDVKPVEQYFRSVAGPECACWRRFPQGKYPDRIGVTSWALWTFAQYGIPAHKSELQFLLSAQGADGGWPLFAGAQQGKFASSYGTAAAILALHGQSALQPDGEQRKRLAAAVRRGADWLKSRAAPGRARWADYPAWSEAREESLAISGFALFALHRVGASWLGSLDRDWMRELPAQAPAALGGEAPARKVQVGKRSYRDETRYYELPWTILATAEVYRSAWFFGKVRAVQWLERALAPR